MAKGLVHSVGFAALVAVGTLGAPVAAFASSILLGASSGSFLFQTNLSPPGTVNVNTGGVSVSGTASFDGDSGAYTLGNSSFLVGPQSGNSFPAGTNSQTFTYTGLFPDTDKLTGTITWSSIHDNTTTPEFFGSLLVGSVAGDAAFTATFAAGQTLPIDLITQALASGGTLEDVANATTNPIRTTALVGSGTLSPIPLPTALPLFAGGLGALGLLGWRRKRRARAAYVPIDQ
jgi:hypothetical protein